jgi:hypothetical protein
MPRHVSVHNVADGIAACKLIRGQIVDADGKGHEFMQGLRQKTGKEATGQQVQFETQLMAVQYFQGII